MYAVAKTARSVALHGMCAESRYVSSLDVDLQTVVTRRESLKPHLRATIVELVQGR